MKMVSTDFWVVLIVSHLLWLFTRSEKRLSEIKVGGSKPQGYFMGFKQKKGQMAHFKCHFIENIFCLKLLPHIKYVLPKMNYSKCVSHDILMSVRLQSCNQNLQGVSLRGGWVTVSTFCVVLTPSHPKDPLNYSYIYCYFLMSKVDVV